MCIFPCGRNRKEETEPKFAFSIINWDAGNLFSKILHATQTKLEHHCVNVKEVVHHWLLYLLYCSYYVDSEIFHQNKSHKEYFKKTQAHNLHNLNFL